MEELSRIEIASDLLDEAYALSEGVKKNNQIDVIYKFLINHSNDLSGIDESLCSHHNLTKELLRVYKKDSWLLVLLDSYEYLRYLDVTESITDLELQILTELDSLKFTFTNIYSYFMDEFNCDKIRVLLTRYYEYLSKGNDFAKSCRDYNFDNQTNFRNALTAYVGNIEALDFISMIFDELDEKYQSQINQAITGEEAEEEFDEEDFEELTEFEDPDEFDEEGYQDAIDEMFDEHEEAVEQIMLNFKNELYTRVNDWFEEHFDDKFECDEFIGFLISYVYMIILNNKENGRLFKEEEALLKLIEGKESTAPLLIESFYDNKEYIFVMLDTLTKYYYKKHMDILKLRDEIEDSSVLDKIGILDEYYPITKTTLEYKIVSTELYEYYDMLFMKYKLEYPKDYLEQFYLALIGEKSLDADFYELDIDGDITWHRVAMIRYFTRKFFEKVYIEPLGVTEEEMNTFLNLNKDEINLTDIIRNFMNHGIVILKGYENTLKQTDVELKNSIRSFEKMVQVRRLIQIDPMLIGESTYYRALNDSELYQYLENNGIEKTVQYLFELGQTNYEEAREFVNEIMVTIYSAVYEKNEIDSLEQTIKLLFEIESGDIEGYTKVVLSDTSLLYQLLSKYYEIEKTEEFPKKYEDKVVKFSKVKQKLYPFQNE